MATPGGRIPVSAGVLPESLEEIRATHRLVAIGGLVMAGGETVALHVSGERKLGSGVAVTPGDSWHLGSCGKAMTATVVARLVERGRVSWTSTIGEVFGTALPSRLEYRDVTVAELLQHRGGVHPATDGAAPSTERIYAAAGSAGDDPRSQRRAAVRAMLAEVPDVPRGEFRYSNSGYILAGAIAEQIAGMLWEDLVPAELFGPLGMKSGGFGAPGTPGLIDQPWPHRLEGGQVVPVDIGHEWSDNLPFTSPIGRVHCSLQDWAAFIRAHLEGEAGSGGYLSGESWATLHRPPPEGEEYAMGWIVENDDRAGVIWRHAGTNGRNYARVWIAPAGGHALLLASNHPVPAAEAALIEAGKLIRSRVWGIE